MDKTGGNYIGYDWGLPAGGPEVEIVQDNPPQGELGLPVLPGPDSSFGDVCLLKPFKPGCLGHVGAVLHCPVVIHKQHIPGHANIVDRVSRLVLGYPWPSYQRAGARDGQGQEVGVEALQVPTGSPGVLGVLFGFPFHKSKLAIRTFLAEEVTWCRRSLTFQTSATVSSLVASSR